MSSPSAVTSNKRAGVLAILVASVLAAAKIVVGFISGSLSLLASAADSAFDVLTSSLNYLAIRTAAKPPDHDHRYGHGKAEALAGLLQAALLCGIGGYLIYRSVGAIYDPQPLVVIETALLVMAASLALTILLVWYQGRVISQTDSTALKADRLHYLSDILTNVGVIVALSGKKWLGIAWLDPVMGILVAAYVIYSSLGIGKESFAILMDTDVSDRYRDSLEHIIAKYPENVLGYHDIRSRAAGDLTFLEFHLEMPRNITLEQSHDLVESVMDDMKAVHPELDIVVHSDPVEIDAAGKKLHLLDEKEPRFY